MHTIRSDASGAAGKKPLFAGEIRGWSSWARVFQDIKLFRPLVQEICRLHDLPFQEPENLTPGTNAVFAVGDMVFKIYAPAEAGFDQSADCDTELFALRRCHSLGVSVPTVIASGTLQDRYAFRYLVQSRCVGKAFREIWPMPDPCETALSVMESTPAEFFTVESTPAEISAMKSTSAKVDFGRNLRRLLAPVNTPCETFNSIDVIHDPERAARWEAFPADFRADRLRTIAALCETVWQPGTYVFVHGDLNEDNILLQGDTISILDFGDACLAPVEYEYALTATELFRLDKAFLRGFFPEYYQGSAPRPMDEPHPLDALADLITRGILIHDFGGDVLRQRFGLCENLHSVTDLRTFIRSRL